MHDVKSVEGELPREWEDVLLYHGDTWKRGHQFTHVSGRTCWCIEGRVTNPRNEIPPTHWAPMLEKPIPHNSNENKNSCKPA